MQDMNNSDVLKNIWYASEKRALSSSKLLVYDDTGSLEIADDELIFLGSEKQIVFDQIQSISLSRQRCNWIAWIFSLILILPIYWLGYLLFNTLFNQGDLFIYLCSVCVVLGLFIGFKTKWVVLDYKIPGHFTGRAYLARSGWSGIFGGTKHLFEYLKKSYINIA